jgi:tetratricopeptide (TPR) repeat protein
MDEADALTAQDRYEQAYLLYQQVYERQLVRYGEDHQAAFIIMFTMAVSRVKSNRFVEALSKFEKVFPKFSSALGDDNPLTLANMSCLAETLFQLKRYDECLAMYETLLPKQERIEGRRTTHINNDGRHGRGAIPAWSF